jgi:hypothetical protein
MKLIDLVAIALLAGRIGRTMTEQEQEQESTLSRAQETRLQVLTKLGNAFPGDHDIKELADYVIGDGEDDDEE